MPSSIRQQILTELIARVAGITIAGGYQTDAGLTVFAGETPQLGPDDPDAVIALVVKDDQATDLSGYGEAPDGIAVTTLPMELQAIVKADAAQPWQSVEAMLADLKQAIETSDRSLSGALAKPLMRGRTRTLRREPGSTVVGVGLEYRAIYADAWGGGAV